MPGPIVYNIVPAPDGSTGIDTNYAISNTLLDYLSDNTKSSLLSVSNIGTAITAKIISALEVISNFTNLEAYLLNGAQLNSLANGNVTSNYSFGNAGSSKLVRVIVILGSITPTGTPTIELISGTDGYSVNVPTGSGEKRIEFNDIPESFVNSFQIQNSTGVSFASSGNSIVVMAL